MKDKEYDVIVIGAGPNGLICTAYLARAGLKVALLEKRHECGGGLDTLELAGFKYNTHAIYHMMAEIMPPFKDFDLGKRGVRYIFPDVQCSYISENNKPIIFYHNPEKTAHYISSNFSAEDGKRYSKMQSDFKEYFDKILLPLTYVPPVPALEVVQALENAKDDIGKKFNDLSEMTPLEILDDYGFSDPIKAAIYNLFSMWGLSNYDGLGFLFPLYVHRMTNAALCSGGSHRLSSALHKVVIEAGGDICDFAEVVKVTLKDGNVSGVLLKDGTELKSRAVASTVDPKQNFIDFFDEGEIPADLVGSAKRWEWEKTSLFGLHFPIREAPKYIGTENAEDANMAMITFLGIDDIDKLLDQFELIENGEIPNVPHGHTTVASLFDPIQSYKNFHTARWESQAPFNADWDNIKQDYAMLCIEEWKKFAPNLDPIDPGKPLIYPPTHIERKLKNMVNGSIKHGSYNTLQMGYNRPNDSCSQSWTPIKGFYVCGASAYPGGMIIGGPGYLGANVIAEDLGVKKTWEEIDEVKKAREMGIISD